MVTPKKESPAENGKENGKEYTVKRNRNNISVKKSRQKSRSEAKDTKHRVEQLRSENKQLENKISDLTKELVLLKEMFIAQATNGK